MMGMGGVCKVTSAPLALLHFILVFYGSFHLAQFSHFCFTSFSLPALRALLLSFIWISFSAMLRERGNPKRGPS